MISGAELTAMISNIIKPTGGAAEPDPATNGEESESFGVLSIATESAEPSLPAEITIAGTVYSTNEQELDLRNLVLQDTDIVPLEYMTNLKILRLNGNLISDLSPLVGLTGLEGLWLEDNQISDVSALSGHTNLIKLALNENQISDVSALRTLTGLKELGLDNNQISDPSDLGALTNLDELYLMGNNISAELISALKEAFLPRNNIVHY